MLRKFGKTLGFAIAVICMVSTMAVAAEMTCMQDNGKGSCTAGAGMDGKTILVDGQDVKKGEKMDCMDKGQHDRVQTDK